jgi:hypothetical protein
MLAYLDLLVSAMTARDVAEIRRLLCHPLMGALPAEVRGEVERFAAGGAPAATAPLQTMRYAHLLSQMLGVVGDAAARRERATDPLARVLNPEVPSVVRTTPRPRPDARRPSPQMDLGLSPPRRQALA